MANPLRVRGTLALSVLAVVTSACGARETTFPAFAGNWSGHGRGLTISRDGVGKESVYSGCCDFVVAVKFRLSRQRVAPGGVTTATATVVAIRFGDKSAFGGPWHPPHLGQSSLLRLKDGVITDPITGTNYCGPSTKHWVCGA